MGEENFGLLRWEIDRVGRSLAFGCKELPAEQRRHDSSRMALGHAKKCLHLALWYSPAQVDLLENLECALIEIALIDLPLNKDLQAGEEIVYIEQPPHVLHLPEGDVQEIVAEP